MNKALKIYHFTTKIKEGFNSFFESINDENTILCFDLEDGISHSHSHSQFSDHCLSKQIHRTQLFQMLLDLYPDKSLSKFGIRINPFGTEDYKKDVEALNQFDDIHSVILPKVEDPDHIEGLISDLKIKVQEILPIIETKKAFKNLDKITTVSLPEFQSIVFGHCDYNLSCEIFPFIHQDSEQYWKWVDYLNDVCKKNNKKLIHSAVLELDNDGLLKETLKKASSFSQTTGIASLCLRQTNLIKSNIQQPDKDFENGIKSHGFNEASDLIQAFESNKVGVNSFALTSGRRLISPHEYKMAKSIVV